MNLACEICGAIYNLDRHHVIPRRMGGSKDPTVHSESNLMTLCRGCHRNFHNGVWDLVRSPEGFWVLDKHTGDLVMRRLNNPDLDPSSMLQRLNSAEVALSELFDMLPYLTDDMLGEVFSYASSFGKRAWLIQAAVLYEAQQRSIYGDRSLEAIARRLEISLRQAQKYALVWKTFFAGDGGEENVNVDVFSLQESSWYVIAATETNDPEKWLSYAQDRKAEDARYSVSWFRQDIQLSRLPEESINGKVSLEGLEITVELPSLENRACPWIRRLCVKLGKPVSLEACQDCEFERGAAES